MTNAVTLTLAQRDDVIPLIALRVADDKAHYVSDNAQSLAQAAYEPGAYPFVIWAGDTRVGMALMVDWREATYRDPDDDPEAVFLWRLMIGEAFAGHGYGTEAMKWLIDWARTRNAKRFVLSHMHGNPAAAFYERLGFMPTGRDRYDGEDLERALVL